MKYIFYFSLIAILSSCSNDVETPTKDTKKENLENTIQTSVESKEELTEMKGNEFIEYYPGKKNIKFKGEKDEKGERNGKWFHYSESGLELSMTYYNHGVKEGFSFVRYPNGNFHYSGDYTNNLPSGTWKTYDENGKLVSEKNYDLK